MKKLLLGLLGIMLTATFTPTVAKAADDWQFAVTPYLWGAGIDGTVKIKGHEADFSKPFDEIIKDLDLAGMLNLQVRKGRFGAYTDVMYLGTSDSTSVLNPATGATLADVSTSLDQWLIDFGASWAVAQWGAGGAGSKGVVDLFLGGRYWNLTTEFTAKSPFFAGELGVEKTADWVDPIVGARFAVDFTPKLLLIGRGDVGGFDLGGSISKLTWSASACLGWRFTPLLSAYAGWKYLSVERESDRGATIDLALSGPVLGLAFTF